jgi:xanthine/CO dehydrogenase XdhC/CoxF family maturation factor
MNLPETSIRQDVLAEAVKWLDEGRRVVLATVIATWGSSPRPVGSQLAVDDGNNMVGSVSGGCIEGDVVHEARQVMETGEPKLLEYGVSNEAAWEVGLACGGTIRLFVEPLT